MHVPCCRTALLGAKTAGSEGPHAAPQLLWQQQMCYGDLSNHDQAPARNHERIVRGTKLALSSLEFELHHDVGSERPRSAVKAEQRRLQQIKDAALHQQKVRKRASKILQRRAARKCQYAHSKGTGMDVPIPSTHWSRDRMALDFHPKYPYGRQSHHTLNGSRFLVTDDEDFGASIQPGRGWKVVATYLGPKRGCNLGGFYSYRSGRDNCYYLAVNPVASQAILSPFWHDYSANWWDEDSDDDGLIYLPPCTSSSWPSLDGLDYALRLALSHRDCSDRFPWLLRLSSLDMWRYARGRLDPVDPTEQLQQRTLYAEAVAALYVTFMWTCPLVVSAGQFAPWPVRVWTPRRFRAIVRLQAHVRGWSVRRSLYSPYTELGQRRLQLLWESFQHDC